MRNAVAAALAAVLGMSTAHAGDLRDITSLKDMPAPVGCVNCWGGLYIGAAAGFGVGRSREKFNDSIFIDELGELVSLPIASRHNDVSGNLLGLYVDYNFSNGPLVYGVQGHFNFSNIDGYRSDVLFLSPDELHKTELQWYGGVNFRAGYAPRNILYYAFVGPVWGSVKREWNVNEFTFIDGDVGFQDSNSSTHFGLTAGVGIEWAMDECWVAKVEYAHVDFNSKRHFQGSIDLFDGDYYDYYRKNDLEFDTIKIGVSYKLRGRDDRIVEMPMK